jgi:hypothetical protein
MSRNNERVLSDAMIEDIKSEFYTDLRREPEDVYVVVNQMMNLYLTGDHEAFQEFISEVFESYEDDILLTLNMELKEDSNDNI